MGTYIATINKFGKIYVMEEDLNVNKSWKLEYVLKGIFYAECTQQTAQHDIIFGGEKMFGFACR